MRSAFVFSFFAVSAAFGFAFGCSSGDLPNGHVTTDGGASPDATATGTGHPGDDGGPGGGDSGGGDSGGGDGGLGVTEVDVPNLPCAKPGGTAIELTAASAGSPTFDRMGAVGTKRFAWSTSGGGLVTFEENASGLSNLVDSVIAARGESSGLVTLVDSSGGMSLQHYDLSAAASGGATQLASPIPAGASVAGGASKSLVAWKDGTQVVGRVLDAGGGVTSTFSLGTDSGGAVGGFHLSAVSTGSDFGVAWSRTRSDGKVETSFAKVSSGGTVSGTKSLIVGGPHSVVQLAKKASGYALLINQGQPSTSMLVMRLDDQGSIVSPTLRLLGGKFGEGIAASGNNVAAVGVLTDGRGVFASFGDDGTPLGRWMCVDDSGANASFDAQVAVDAAGSGFAVLSHRTNGASALLYVDATGLGL